MSATDHLDAMFDAYRRLRAAEDEFVRLPANELTPVLDDAISAALKLSDEAERIGRLRLMADLSAQVQSAAATRLLLRLLDSEDEGVRTEAGEALLDVAYRRFKEVAEGIEGALDEGRAGPGMQELPFMLAEIRDPDPLPLIQRFLEHEDASVVASAIEALAQFGDPSAAPALEALLEDERVSQIEALEDEPVMIAVLAASALEELVD